MPKNEVQHKNEVHLSGELAKDAIVRATAAGQKITTLTVLTRYKTRTEYHKVCLWDELADRSEALHKGEFVKIVGRLQNRSWEDKQTGQKKYSTEIVAFQFVIPGNDPPPLTPDAINGGTAAARAILSPAEKNVHGIEISDDDIPF
jgi:single-strand DNA-binding protein